MKASILLCVAVAAFAQDKPEDKPSPVVSSELSAELGWAQFELAQAQAVMEHAKEKADAAMAKVAAVCGGLNNVKRADGRLTCTPSATKTP